MTNLEVNTFGKDTRTRYRITSEADAVRVIEELERDKRTGLYRREVFEDKAQEMLETASQNKTSMAYLMVDVDHFKRVNDAHGHPIGDAVLAYVAQTLKNNVRMTPTNPHYERRCGSIDGATDLVGIVNEETVEIGRVGGEEFGIALYGADAAQAYAIAERVRTALEQNPFSKDRTTIPITVSIGIATTETATTWDDIYHGADQALYCAKHNGRNRTELSSRGLAASHQDRADPLMVGSDHTYGMPQHSESQRPAGRAIQAA